MNDNKDQLDEPRSETASQSITSANAIIECHGKPIMIWKIGSDARGWIPNSKHLKPIVDFIKKSKLEERYDVFLYHFAVQVEVIHPRSWYRRIFG